MHRIDHITADADANGSGKAGYTGGNAATQTPATVVTPAAMNAIQEELCLAVEGAGITLSSGSNAQLLAAINALATTLDVVASRAMNLRVIGMAIASHQTRTAPAVMDYYGVVYGTSDSLFVAVGGHVSSPHTSPDGVTWTSRSAGTSRAVCHGNGTFVCVGDAAAIYSSADGITYTPRTAGGGYAGSFRSCTASASLFVAGGTLGAIQTSTDGASWVARTAAASFAGGFLGACNGGGVYVLVGEDTSVTEIQTSPDGTTWTRRTPSEASGTLYSVAYGDGVYVAVGIDGGGDNLIMRSTDAITWATRAATGTGGILSVTYDETRGVFVAVGVDGYISISTDGLTWTDLSRTSFTTNLRCVGFGDGTCVMAGSSPALQQSLALVGLDAI